MYCNLVRNARHIPSQMTVIPRIRPQYTLSTKATDLEVHGTTSATPKRKTSLIPKITLISYDQHVEVTTMEEAEKMCKRRDMKLVKVVDSDSKTRRPVYRIMTGPEYLAEDLKQREKRKAEKANPSGVKGEKVLIMNSTIAHHDLTIQIGKILKWIKRNYEVRVVINGASSNLEKVESVYKFLAEQISGQSRIVQKRTKGNDMKFQVLPPKQNNENNSGEAS